MRRDFLKLAVALTLGSALAAPRPGRRPGQAGNRVWHHRGRLWRHGELSIKPILEKQGYKVKLVEFTDYVRPNLALAEGSIDVNIFQHKPYLDNFAKEHKLALTPVAQVPTGRWACTAASSRHWRRLKAGSSVRCPTTQPTRHARW